MRPDSGKRESAHARMEGRWVNSAEERLTNGMGNAKPSAFAS
jgi:hypothetical protein